MSSTKGIEIACETAKLKKSLFENYMKVVVARELKRAFSEVLNEDVRLIVFGSVVRGNFTPLSDGHLEKS